MAKPGKSWDKNVELKLNFFFKINFISFFMDAKTKYLLKHFYIYTAT